MICLDGFYGIFRSSAAHPRNENGVAGVCEKNSLILGLISLAFLGVLGALAVNVLSCINRQDAKSAKNSPSRILSRRARILGLVVRRSIVSSVKSPCPPCLRGEKGHDRN